MSLPTGTVTFLFTDIEGSTRLWQDHQDAMQLALSRHDALLREAIESRGGAVFKTIGDAFCAAFPTATSALEAALSAQRGLQEIRLSDVEPAGAGMLPVRMALHTGEVQERDGDYFGAAVNRVARLLSTAHGRQILTSDVTQGLVRDFIPPGAALKDLGEHRLRDLARPERVFQALHVDLPSDFPPLRSMDAFPNNLRQQLTSFIGREKESADVKKLLASTRLLTLIGPGGAGKTRLALQVAADVLDHYPDGVWLVELDTLSDPALIPITVAAALGLREEPGRPMLNTLADALKPRQLLFVLDNCEHVLNAAGELATTILSACPSITILATSRESLCVTGEQGYRVPSLSLPDPREIISIETLSQFEAVRLLIERILLCKPAFTVTNANAPAVAHLCQRLDGIPLAIELAAARVKSLPVEQIAARLDDRFRLLTGGSRTALPKHQTLRALVDWSHDLLRENERILLRRLSVFAGGWTIEAAEAVCEGGSIEAWELLDLLSSLVEKSLVVYEERNGEARYRLLETVRQYAREKLADAGEKDAVHGKHLDYFLNMAEEAEPKLWAGAEEALWLERLEAEHDNLRAAMDCCSGSEHAAIEQMRLAAALGRFWVVRGHFAEGCRRMEEALAKTNSEPPELHAKTLHRAIFLHLLAGDHRRTLELVDEALPLVRELGDKSKIAFIQGMPGLVAFLRGDLQQAKQRLEENLPLARESGDKWLTGGTLPILGIIAFHEGDNERAMALLEEGYAVCKEVGEKSQLTFALIGLGKVAFAQGDYARAATAFSEGLRASGEVRDQRRMAQCLEGLAGVAAEQGNAARAAKLFGAAEAVRETIRAPIPPADIEAHTQAVATARESLSPDEFAAAWAVGRGMKLDAAVGFSLGIVA